MKISHIYRKKKFGSDYISVTDSNNFYQNFKITSRPDLPPENERNDYFSIGKKRVKKLLSNINGCL